MKSARPPDQPVSLPSPARFRLWAGVWLVLTLVALRFDTAVMDTVQDWRVRSGGEQSGILNEFELYARGYGTAVIVVLMLLLDRRRRDRAVALGLTVLIVSLANHGVKRLTGRERPYRTFEKRENYQARWRGPAEGFESGSCQSFASGHTIAAVSQSVALARFYPAGAPVFYALTAVVAAERVYHEKHYLGDTLGAALLGWLMTIGLLSRPVLWRVSGWIARLGRPQPSSPADPSEWKSESGS